MIKYHQLTLQSNNYIDLQLHSYQQSKQKNKQTNRNNFHSGERWKLISSAQELEQK